jgi:hypothetical protein
VRLSKYLGPLPDGGPRTASVLGSRYLLKYLSAEINPLEASCMWREGALGPAINIVASLCADVRFFGLALRMGALAAGFFCFCPALTGVVHWSVLESLVRGVRFGTISHNYVGVVGGALAPWGPVVQLARSVDVTTSHTTTMGSWEVNSDVGLVSAGEDTLWGVLSLVGGGLRCCFRMFRVQMG